MGTMNTPTSGTSVGVLTAIAGLLFANARAAAQDSRAVIEPRRPASCIVLEARHDLVGDSTVAAAAEQQLDSPRIQQALNGCAAGRAVVLRQQGTRRAFVSGPLTLPARVTLVVDSGVVLFASRDARVFDRTPGACGRLAPSGRGCVALINAERADSSGVMGPGTIDGRGWAPLLADTVSWWEMAEQARDTRFSQNNPRLIQTSRTNGFTLAHVTLRNSPNFHVVFERGDGFTAWGVIINTPKGARNTDGIDPSGSRNVSILHSFIHTGDDNVAIKAGSNGGAQSITVAESHFYGGHGVSIGSETDGGARNILVRRVTFEGTDNALRIKSNGSRGGRVEQVTYDDICIRNVKYPIFMDSHYSASPERDGALIPEYRDILVRGTHIEGRGTVVLDGYDAQRPVRITMDGVVADSPSQMRLRVSHAHVTLGAGGSNLAIPDTVIVRKVADGGSGAVPSCATRWVPFPGRMAVPVTVRRLMKPSGGPVPFTPVVDR